MNNLIKATHNLYGRADEALTQKLRHMISRYVMDNLENPNPYDIEECERQVYQLLASQIMPLGCSPQDHVQTIVKQVVALVTQPIMDEEQRQLERSLIIDFTKEQQELTELSFSLHGLHAKVLLCQTTCKSSNCKASGICLIRERGINHHAELVIIMDERQHGRRSPIEISNDCGIPVKDLKNARQRIDYFCNRKCK